MFKFIISLIVFLPLQALAGDVDQLIKAGENASAAGDWDKAIALYKEAVDADPDSSVALTRLAGSYLATNQYIQSIPLFQQAISKNTNNPGAFIGMGLSYLHMGRFRASKAAFTEAKKYQPDNPEIDRLLKWIEKKLQQSKS